MLKTQAHLLAHFILGPSFITRVVWSVTHTLVHTHTHTRLLAHALGARFSLSLSHTHSHTRTPAIFRHTPKLSVWSLSLTHALSHALSAWSHSHTHSQAHSPVSMSHTPDRPYRLLAHTRTPLPCFLSLTPTRVCLSVDVSRPCPLLTLTHTPP
jgi:hypothetical protein